VFAICTSTLGFWIGRNWDSTSRPSFLAKEITNYCKTLFPLFPILPSLAIPSSNPRRYSSILHPNPFQRLFPQREHLPRTLKSRSRCRLALPRRELPCSHHSPSLAQKSGLAHDQVKINQKYGSGYHANIEGLHHLHCLNLLRQRLWYNYDYYHSLGEGAFKNEDYIVKFHMSHCLDIIRQQLMCTIDVGCWIRSGFILRSLRRM
jgi:hypothetical protein